MNEGLTQVIEKLNIYSLSQDKIIKRSDYLSKLRYSTPDEFTKQTTLLFTSLVRPKNLSNPTVNIDLGEVISTSFALSNPLDQSGKSPLNKTKKDVNNLIQSFMGFAPILDPTYFISKSLKEKDSSWLEEDFSKLYLNKQHMIEKIEELKEELLKSINLPDVRNSLATQFGNSLNLKLIQVKTGLENYLDQSYSYLKMTAGGRNRKEQKGFPRKVLSLVEPKEAELYVGKVDRFADQYMLGQEEARKHETKGPYQSILGILLNSKTVDEETLSSMKSRKWQKPNVALDDMGNIIINEPVFVSHDRGLRKDDPDIVEGYLRLTSIFGKGDYQDLAATALISHLSSDTSRYRNIIPNVNWLNFEGKNYYKNTRNVVKSFRESLVDIFTNKLISQEIAKNLSKVISRRDFNFSSLNQRLADILFSHYSSFAKEGTNIKTLSEFLKISGVRPAILALRKIFLIKSLKTQMEDLHVGGKKGFILNPHPDVSVEPQNKFGKTIEPSKFLDISQTKILEQQAFFAVEKYLRENRSFLKSGQLIAKKKDGRYSIELPDNLNSNKINSISVQGIDFPINTRVEKNIGGNLFFNINFHDTTLGQIPIDILTL